MISVEDAKGRILEALDVVDVVEVNLSEARGRVLAEDVVADRDFPPTARSAMDGFAVRAADVAGTATELRVTTTLRAGQPAGETRVRAGEAVRIMTGAILPPGADAVVMVELTEMDPARGVVRILGEPPRPGHHVRRQGEDVRSGEPVLRGGCPIHAPEVATLAAVGRTRVRVYRPPVVHVLSTGDEIVEPTQTPADHQVRNSNAWALLAQLEEMDLRGCSLGISPDTPDGLARAIRQGLDGDLLLITAGVSVGEYDLVGEVLSAEGVTTIFHNVAIRPGKPMLVGRRGRCLVVGLPGNPVSTFTDFAVFVAPAVRKMAGFARWDNAEVRAVLAERLKRKPGRTTYHLARVTPGDRGFVALPVRTMGSGDVVSMCRANAFVVTDPAPRALDAGTEVPAVLWRDFHLR